MVLVAIGLLAGVCTLLSLPVLAGAGAAALVCATGGLIALLTRQRAFLAFALGFCLCWHDSGRRLGDRLDPQFEGRTLSVRGVVDSVPQAVAEGVRFRFATVAEPGVSSLIELTWYEPSWTPRPAERLALEVRLRRPRGFANPGGAGYEARMLREGIGATGYVRAATSEGRDWRDVLRRPVLVARGAASDAIRGTLGERPATGIVAGLSVGLQDALSMEQWRALARSGTSHLMAISGMHIGMLAALAAWFAMRVQGARQRRGARGSSRDVGVVVGTVVALAYSALAGWSVPTQRTVIMITVVAGALLLRRRTGSAEVLALGLIAVLLHEPLAPLAVGFWLSFGAVAAILIVGSGHLARPGLVRGFALAQLAVTVGLVPVLVGCFGSVSLVSVLVNIVAIPLYTIIVVPAVLLATACVLLSPAAGTAALGAVAWLIEVTWPLIEGPAAWPLATWGYAGLPPLAWCALLVGSLAALAPLPVPGRIAGALIVVALGAWRAQPPPTGAVHLAVLDVGQGLAAVIETRRHVLVYDAGPAFRSGSDAGALAVEPYLRYRGVRTIDLLVASHDDNDHAGGAATVAGLLPVHRRAASGRALDRIGPVVRCRAGERWTWDRVTFEWLHPGPDLLPDDNDRSCVLRVRAGPHVLMLTGDVERLAEQELLAREGDGAVDVLLVPHHGSRTSSSPPFVAATRPRWAIVSAGHRNRWGFPVPAVVERWQAASATVLVTSVSGAIEFDVRPDRPLQTPGQWRIGHRRFWQDP